MQHLGRGLASWKALRWIVWGRVVGGERWAQVVSGEGWAQRQYLHWFLAHDIVRMTHFSILRGLTGNVINRGAF